MTRKQPVQKPAKTGNLPIRTSTRAGGSTGLSRLVSCDQMRTSTF